MAQYSSNSGRKTINNAKIGCFLTLLGITGIASIFQPAFLFLFFPLLIVFIILAIIVVVMKSSKTARKLNYTSTLVSNYRKYGAGDWHTIQAVRIMVIDYYQNQHMKVDYLEFVNDWGNHYTGQITIDGKTYPISIVADGSGNLNWDLQ